MNKLIIFISIVLFVACKNNESGCNRDKGSYEVEGVVIDPCSKKPLKDVLLSAYIYSDEKTTITDSMGYFHLTASWDVERGIFSKQSEVVLIIRYFDDSLQGNVDAVLMLSNGYTNMGPIMTAYVELPLKFEVDSTTCTNCKWDIAVSQKNSWKDMYPNSIILHSIPTTPINYSEFLTISWDTINQIPLSPILLNITEIDSTNKRSEKPVLDISENLNLCGFGDTVIVKL
jgi:hypothetical protein